MQTIQLYDKAGNEILGGTDTLIHTTRYTPYTSVPALLKSEWIESRVSVARNIKRVDPVRVKVYTDSVVLLDKVLDNA